MRAEPSQLVRLSTHDVAPADRLSYASWILSSALAPSALSTGTPSEYESQVTALELPSIAIVAQGGSPQRTIRARPEIRRTSQRYFFLVLVLSGSWQVTNVTRTRFGPGDLIFYDSRYPLDCDLLVRLDRFESAAVGTVRAPMGAQSCRAERAAHLSRFTMGARPRELRRPVVAGVRRAGPAAADVADRSTRSAIGPDREPS